MSETIPPGDKQLIDYYDMWTERMDGGAHNPASHAIHFGYSDRPDAYEATDADSTKLATNSLLAEAIDAGSGMIRKVADLGCGVGSTALSVAGILPPDHTVFAVNIHHPQLRLARSFSTDSKRVVPVNADFSRLPFRDSTLDAAYAVESSCHAADKPTFFQEALRCLKPAARLVVLDYFDLRRPANETEREQFDSTLAGWAVPNLHKIPDAVPGATAAYCDITENMMPDMQRSYAAAVEKLETATDPVMRGHLEGMVALYEGMAANDLQYGMLTLTKI